MKQSYYFRTLRFETVLIGPPYSPIIFNSIYIGLLNLILAYFLIVALLFAMKQFLRCLGRL